MKVLFIAYKIEKDKGSEDGTAYNILRLLGKENIELTLVTRKNNIDKLKDDPDFLNIRMIAVEVPKKLSFYKKKGRGIILYYYLWQIFSGIKIFNLQKSEHFDIIHQFNFHATWAPHFIFSKSKIVFGPLTHHEKVPFSFWYGNRIGYLTELMRQCFKRFFIYCDPFVKWSIRRSHVLLFGYRNYTGSYKAHCNKIIMLPQAGTNLSITYKPRSDIFNILFVGRFVSLKGCIPALLAVEKMLNHLDSHKQSLISFTLIGEGRLYNELNKIAERINRYSNARVNIIPWLNQTELPSYYNKADLFLFPSFEGQGLVIAEAMAHGCPVLCLEDTGPAYLAGPSAITVPKTNINTTVSVLALQIEHLFNEFIYKKTRYNKRMEHAFNRANELSWQNKAASLMSIYHG